MNVVSNYLPDTNGRRPQWFERANISAVSYTHLTLPTNREV